MVENSCGRAPGSFVREALGVGAVVTVAVSVRLLFLARWAGCPLFQVPLGDELNFHQTALALLAGGSDPEAFLYQPLYSFFLALSYRMVGVDVAAVRSIQLLIGTGTTLILYGLGRELGRLGARPNDGRRVGKTTALLGALYGPLVFFEGQLLDPALTVPLTASALWCGLAAGKRGRLWLLALAGVLGGLAMMGRPNLAVLLPVAGAWLFAQPWPWRRRLLAAGLALLGVAMGLSPSWIYNARRGHGLVVVSASAGHSFYIGNNPQATGAFRVPRGERIDDSSHQAYRESLTAVAEQAEQRKLTPTEVSCYWFKRGLDFWMERPFPALGLSGKKLLLALSTEESAIHIPYLFGRELAPVLGYLLPFGVVFPFAVLGAWLLTPKSAEKGTHRAKKSLRSSSTSVAECCHHSATHCTRRNQGARLLLFCAAAYLATLVVFYVADRYRILLVPMLLPLASAGMFELGHRFRQHGLQRSWLPLLVLAGSFGLTQLPWSSPAGRANAMSAGYNWMGKAEGDRGNILMADRYFRRAVEIGGPDYRAVSLTNLGLVLELRGDLVGAEKLYRQAAAADPEYRYVRDRLARISEQAKDLPEAIGWWEELAPLSAQPGRVQAEIARLRRLLEEKKPDSDRR